MTPLEAKQAFGDKTCIRVRTRSGAEYDVDRDVVESWTDSWTDPNSYIYGFRSNGRIHHRYRRRIDTRNQLKYFYLKHVTLVITDGSIEEYDS